MRLPADDTPRPRWLLPALAGLALFHFAWYLWITYTQYQSNMVFLADAGIFDFMMAGPKYGHFFREPLQWNTPGNWLSVHFSPILMIYMPIYFLIDHAMVYLGGLVGALAFAGFLAGVLAWRWTANAPLAIAFSLLFHWNHFVGSIHLANHHEALGLPAMLLLMVGASRRSDWMMAVGALCALATKEDYVLYVLAFGVHLMLEMRLRLRRRGAMLAIGAVLWALFADQMMKLAGQEAFHAAGHQPLVRYASMGATKGEIILHMLSNPVETLGRIFRTPLFLLLASTALLALADWRGLWMLLAAAAVFLVADDIFVRDFAYYYSYPTIPFLIYASIRGAREITARIPERRRPLFLHGLVGVLAIAAIVNGVLPTRTDGFRRGPFTPTPHALLADEVIKLIPPDAKIAVQYDLYTKVPNREVKLPFRLQWIDEVDYILIDLNGRPADLMGEEKRAEREVLIPRALSDEFETLFEGDGYLLRKRRE